jgi:hypothetical protein
MILEPVITWNVSNKQAIKLALKIKRKRQGWGHSKVKRYERAYSKMTPQRRG